MDPREKEAVQKAGALLDEGLKPLETRQKHIKVADRSDFGWSTVEHYESHPLAEDSDDEKKLEKAEKEAERAANKCQRGGGGAGNKRKCWPGPAGPSSRQREPQPTQAAGPPPLLPQGPVRPRIPVLGPCFFCGQFGHLVKSCPKETLYPLKQPVVSKAERSADSHESGGVLIMNDMCHQSTTCEVSTSEVDVKQCVDNPGIFDQINSTEDMSFEGNPDEPYMEGETSIFWEVEANSPPDQITDVQGRLKKKVLFWKEVLHAPPPIIGCITNGYRLPHKFHPLPHCQHNQVSTETHHQFVDEAVQGLLLNRCVTKVNKEPYVCSPLSVVSNSVGKLRLVLNLHYLNQSLHVTKFKYEDLRVAALMFEKHEYMFKFDLKSGYHHVDIFSEHQRYLGFRWDDEGTPQYDVFTVLPFGLATACYIFSKLLRLLVRYWRGRGLKAIVYLDDGIIAVKGKAKAREESERVRHDLESAGFIVNMEKSVWEPAYVIEWLGFQINLSEGKFKVPENKL